MPFLDLLLRSPEPRTQPRTYRTSLADLEAAVHAQKTAIPRMYGHIDFDVVPERFTTDPTVRSMLPEPFARIHRQRVLADDEEVLRMRAYTMLGDTVADAYAALTPEYGFRRLIDMLVRACEKGLQAVPEAPPELHAFIGSMEALPDWIDPALSAEGARAARIRLSILAPKMIRGAFIATFMNKYSGLPMALTGTLADDMSARRVKETASFFLTAALPDALSRFGPGFRAAAMVRLMHSMVRANILMRSKEWDPAVYGIPVPQVDQMPAGLIPAGLAAYRAVQLGRDFTHDERAIVELCRHQCFLLGLPADLLRETPGDLFETALTYGSTLRDGYDDATNGALVRSTMAAVLRSDDGLRARISEYVERGVSKVFFRTAFQVPRDKAEQMGVVPSALDYALFTGFHAVALPRVAAHMVAARLPIAERLADRRLVGMLDDLLASYGHAEYTTDPSKYRAEQRGSHGPPHRAVGAPA